MTIAQGVGALLLVGGGWLLRAAAHELAWNATPVWGGAPARALIVTGPCRRVRHPMYAGAVARFGPAWRTYAADLRGGPTRR